MRISRAEGPSTVGRFAPEWTEIDTHDFAMILAIVAPVGLLAIKPRQPLIVVVTWLRCRNASDGVLVFGSMERNGRPQSRVCAGECPGAGCPLFPVTSPVNGADECALRHPVTSGTIVRIVVDRRSDQINIAERRIRGRQPGAESFGRKGRICARCRPDRQAVEVCRAAYHGSHSPLRNHLTTLESPHCFVFVQQLPTTGATGRGERPRLH